MPITHIHSFLVHPSKHDKDQPAISGTQVKATGPLGPMLRSIYDVTPHDCTEIQFLSNEDGTQQNDCRDLLIGYVKQPSVPNGRKIAAQLQAVTTHRSGLGLLFLMVGKEGRAHRLAVSRFPADSGVLAEEKREELTVAFIERIFMKSSKAYKSVYFESDSLTAGFWDGLALDKQISDPREVSDYWIKEFLMSDFRTTAAQGTRRVAVALRQAIRGTDSLAVRRELTAAAQLMRGQAGRRVTARQIVNQLGLSEDASEALEQAMPRPDLMDERFQFSANEFESHILYRSVELDNGAMLTAEDANFGEVFTTEEVDDRVRYSTTGHVIDESLKKTK